MPSWVTCRVQHWALFTVSAFTEMTRSLPPPGTPSHLPHKPKREEDVPSPAATPHPVSKAAACVWCSTTRSSAVGVSGMAWVVSADTYQPNRRSGHRDGHLLVFVVILPDPGKEIKGRDVVNQWCAVVVKHTRLVAWVTSHQGHTEFTKSCFSLNKL